MIVVRGCGVRVDVYKRMLWRLWRFGNFDEDVVEVVGIFDEVL